MFRKSHPSKIKKKINKIKFYDNRVDRENPHAKKRIK